MLYVLITVPEVCSASTERTVLGGFPAKIFNCRISVVTACLISNKRVRVRNVRFGLEVVVIAHEVFHRIVREERFEFLVELCRKRLVVREDQRRLAHVLDDVRHRESLAGTRHAEERLELFSVLETFGQFLNRFWLVTRRTVRAYEFKVRARVGLELLQVSRQTLFGR